MYMYVHEITYMYVHVFWGGIFSHENLSSIMEYFLLYIIYVDLYI